MDYDFQRHEPCFDRVLFVLALDRKKMKERIIAGTEAAVRSRLRGNQDAEVICDVTRPLGTFLTEFEQDLNGEWNMLGLTPLREALHTNRWKQPDLEKAAGSFLRQKYQTGDPVRQYAAFRIWEGYLVAREYRNRNAACERFVKAVSPFAMAFQTNTTADFEKRTGRPAPLDPSYRLPSRLLPEDSRLDLWYPDHQTGMECACAYASFYPVMIYYLNRLKDWGLHFWRCQGMQPLFSLQKASDMSCAVKNAGKQSPCRISGILMSGQERIIMTCFIKMSARTGGIKSIKQKRQPDSRKKDWKIWTGFASEKTLL